MRAFHPEKVPVPPDFRPLPLQSGLPLDIEIGCGVGFHPLQYARAHPERQLIAFERTSEKFAKFQQRLAHHDPLPNLTAIHGDAIAWITHGLRSSMVDRYFVLYPNPYPKESQRNLRFPEMPFFAHLRNTMKPGGTLTLATNARFYAEDAITRMKEWRMELVEEIQIPPGFPPRTHFEKKYLLRGEACWNLEFRASDR